jgi:hypothetical protein
MDRAHLRRVFEESLAQVQAKYAPEEDVMVEARALNDQGQSVVVARYKLYVDGRMECFAVLDDVLWPPA